MTGLLDLLREDLRDFAGYASARRSGVTGRVWLNANESPWPNPADAGQGNHRYPDPQPAALREALASLYGAQSEQLLIGRGSDEAIDLLVRALCRPGQDAVLVTPPVFGMYAVSARLQGARLLEVPLQEDAGGFHADPDALADAALAGGAKLVFVCSPGNPTGQAMPVAAIRQLAQRLHGRALVVVDEAYGEYSDQPSVVADLGEHNNLAVLRTLSKAHGLAGARIGSLIAAPELVAALRNCQAPYPLPTPCVELAMSALSGPNLALTRIRIATVRAERSRIEAALCQCPLVRRVYPSQGNYLLVRFVDADAAFQRLLAAGVVVRDMRSSPVLHDALRLSIGSCAENDALLEAFESIAVVERPV